MRVAIFINSKAGQNGDENDSDRELVQKLETHRITPHLYKPLNQQEFQKALRAAAQEHPAALVAVGGDGTVSTVAGECLRSSIPLGVVPLGTFNHFAKDLGIPIAMDEAIACIARYHLKPVDVGEVNGRLFINNSSIGAYPRAVLEREEICSRYDLHKAFAMAIAVLRVFSRRPFLEADFEIDGRRFHRRTPFIFVGNNQYEFRPGTGPTRPRLTGGDLCLYISSSTGLGGLLKMLCLALLGRLDSSAEFESFCARELVIRMNRTHLRAANDGEVLEVENPLHYRVLPSALKVIGP